MAAFTQTDLDNVQAAIAKGELIVEFGDRKVTYRSIAELKAAADYISNQLNTPRSKQFRGVAGKGFC